MESIGFIVYDADTREIVSTEEYKKNQEKIKNGDPSAKNLAIIDKRVVIIENGIIIGVKSLSKEREKTLEESSQPKPNDEVPKYPASISDAMDSVLVPVHQELEINTEAPAVIEDPDVFVKLVNQKQRENNPYASSPVVSSSPTAVYPFDSPFKDDDDIFIKVTNRHRRLQELKEQAENLTPELLITQLISEHGTQKEKQALASRIIYEARSGAFDDVVPTAIEGKQDAPQLEASDYGTVYNQSVSAEPRLNARPRKNRFISPSQVVAFVLAAGITFTAIGLTGRAIANSDVYQNLQSSMQMKSILDTLKKNDATFNNVNPNKILIPNQRDSYNHPAYWLDTDGVAKSILNEGDMQYTAALYYAYYQMEDIRNVGQYHNWDNVISSISRIVSPESHPTAFNMTSNCHGFNDFLIKNGLINADGSPSPEMFEEFGKEALKAYSETVSLGEEAPSYGGR